MTDFQMFPTKEIYLFSCCGSPDVNFPSKFQYVEISFSSLSFFPEDQDDNV